jgi:dienelactone hydrolase
MREVGMSGHSFGAQTTLAVAGGNYAGTMKLLDTRIKASIAFSPQPSRGEADRAAFGGITMPFFTVTGTEDSFARFGGTSASDRLRPYQAMPVGQKYLLVLAGANHMMLNGQTLQRPNATPTPGMVDTITDATVLFWRATLMHDQNAAARLQARGAHVRPGDQFASK